MEKPQKFFRNKVVSFSRLLKCLRSLYGKQCGPRSDVPIGAVCSGSTLFASILNLSVMIGNYLQQTTAADDISDAFFLGALRVIMKTSWHILTLFAPFTTIIVCSLMCLCAIVVFIANNTYPDQTAREQSDNDFSTVKVYCSAFVYIIHMQQT